MILKTSCAGRPENKKSFSERKKTMKTRNLIVMLLAIAMMLTSMIGASAEVVELPRNETLYFAGQQWGSVNSWNVIGTNQNNAMAIAGGAGGYRTLMFETLFMYNFMDGSLTGLLGDTYT